MSILYKFNELDYPVLAVPVNSGDCSTCHLNSYSLGCVLSSNEQTCSVILEEEDGVDLYVFKKLVER